MFRCGTESESRLAPIRTSGVDAQFGPEISVGRITLGRHALLGPEVFITASNYQTKPGTPVMDQPKLERDVVIGDDVWLGARVIVVAGVEIGDGCIIGASSVVTRSIPAGSIAVGNPARVVGHRGDPKSIGNSGSGCPVERVGTEVTLPRRATFWARNLTITETVQ